VQKRTQHVAGNGDVAQRPRGNPSDEHHLAREQVRLAQKSRRPVTDDLITGTIKDRDLARDDRDER
jgi:hypothetical protein